FHNPRMRRRVARQDQKLSALSQPSVISGVEPMSSPTLVNQVATFLLSGGTIEFGEVPAGAMGIFQAAHGTEDAFIRIGDQILDSLNTGSTYRLEQFLGTIAHELGHAMTTMEGFDFDVSSRQTYIDSGFASEAYAVLNAMLVMHEIT